jgi:hypothetical protein
MSKTVDIVELIESNPITRLTSTYQSNLLTKIKSNFTDNEQQMFVASFYCFLNCNQKNDFVIDLDNVWKWLEFSTKQKAKDLLEKHFTINIDYTLLLNQQVKQTAHMKGGHNKETFMLTVKTFKLFCLKAGTKKAEQIHEYYIKLEEILHEVIQEETNELKLQLEQKNIIILNEQKDKDKIREKTIIEQFPKNTQCVYYGTIDNLSDKKESLIKFGNSNNLKNRVSQHKDTYLNFKLINAFKVDNKLQIENAIKSNTFFRERLRTITLKTTKFIELLNFDGITFTDIDKSIKEIITEIEYSPENYIKILEQNKLFKKQLEDKNEFNNTNNVILLTTENNKLKIENIKLIKKYNFFKKRCKLIFNNNTEDDSIFVDELIEQIPNEEPYVHFNETMDYHTIISNNNDSFNKDFKKNKDGSYYINGKLYSKLYGTRDQVWNEISFQTTGHLTKLDLNININGKIVSKKKCIQETINQRFTKYGVNKPKENTISTI